VDWRMDGLREDARFKRLQQQLAEAGAQPYASCVG